MTVCALQIFIVVFIVITRKKH